MSTLEQSTDNEEKIYCYYHPNVETRISCSSCGKPICPQDMVYTSVGVKCRECAKPVGRTAAGAKPIYYIRGAAAGLGAAIVGGIGIQLLRRLIPFGGFILAIILGYAIGEAISWGARRNSGLGFQIIAGISALIAFTLGGYIIGRSMYTGNITFLLNPISLLIAALGIFTAVARMR